MCLVGFFCQRSVIKVMAIIMCEVIINFRICKIILAKKMKKISPAEEAAGLSGYSKSVKR